MPHRSGTPLSTSPSTCRILHRDPQRRAEAQIPDAVGFATKPQPARRLIETAVAGGLPCRWVAGDEAYGGDPQLAAALRGHRLGYVLAVACSPRAPTGLGIPWAD